MVNGMPPRPSTEQRERKALAGRPPGGGGRAAGEVLPRWIPIYKLIWRERYGPSGGPRPPR